MREIAGRSDLPDCQAMEQVKEALAILPAGAAELDLVPGFKAGEIQESRNAG